MKFTPKSEEEISSSNLYQPGIYDFEIIKATETLSKAKNEMIVLTLKVYDQNGDSKLLNDYLLESIEYKLRHCADACGLLDKYITGNLSDADFLGKAGKVKLAITKGKAKPDGSFYADQNSVSDYIKRDAASSLSNSQQSAPLPKKDFIDDEIPF